MQRRFDLAILGADSQIGTALLELLAERRFPAGEISALGRDAEAGASVEFAGHTLPIDEAAAFDFAQVQLAFLADDDPKLAAAAERAADAGCVVVDASGSVWRDPAIPRVVAGVNAEALAGFNERGIVAAPDRALVPLLKVLAPIHRRRPLQTVTLTVLVPVSDGGRLAFQDLARETTALLNARHHQRGHFAQQIAFNVHGQIGAVDGAGVGARERQLVEGLRDVLAAPTLAVSVHMLQAPLFYGYAMTVDLAAAETLTPQDVAGWLAGVDGVEIREAIEAADCPSPVVDAMTHASVQVARLRQGASAQSVALWLTADNIRCAAAANAVECAEILVRDYL
ncbi:Asd/ArgC dimerization domain-containing protein [Sinimarinibacterium thermocellulolyticum]|uniref:Asd/ArgC dimerization domain-containing protein n=1 Tax=Sinimarinibacterium thermocellulolyticum TaxID=3170016 RepID=A0ABV2ACC2_9GAMM